MRWLALVGVLAVAAGCGSGGNTTATVTPPAPREVAVAIGAAGSELPGTLLLPPGQGPFPLVVLVAGSGPNDRDETFGPNKPFKDLAEGLAVRGVATVRYDKRTRVYRDLIGRQLDTFTPTEEYVPDAVAAFDLMGHRPEIDPRRVFVLGHSQGGTFAPRIAAGAQRVAGVILMAAGAERFGAGLLRQVSYIAKLQPLSAPSTQEQISALKRQAALIDDPHLPLDTPRSALPGGLGPPYWLDLTHYDEVATARALPQPILVLQGDRDYQVTVADDLVRWQRGLAGRSNVTFKRYPRANHIFFDGAQPSTPDDYQTPGHMGTVVISDIAAWVLGTRTS